MGRWVRHRQRRAAGVGGPPAQLPGAADLATGGPMKVRAKARVTAITTHESGDVSVTFHGVAPRFEKDADGKYVMVQNENADFAAASPSFNLQITINKDRPASGAFAAGAEYYVDFTPAE